MHWPTVCVIGALDVAEAVVIYHLLERPAMPKAKPIAAWLRRPRRIVRRRPAVSV